MGRNFIFTAIIALILIGCIGRLLRLCEVNEEDLARQLAAICNRVNV